MRYQKRGDDTRARILFMLGMRQNQPLQPAPTIREIAAMMNLSTATVHRQIKVLSDLGLVDYTPGLARTIRLRPPVMGDKV